ncbi:MAG: class I SAM-dependent methyltransferase [Gemmatimonadota bacterium]|jgi:hypothetical protein
MQRRGRRWLVDFDPEHFRHRTGSGAPPEPVEAFREAYHGNLWRGESRSGPGSDPDQADGVVRALPGLCGHLGVARLLDLPCGDFSWMARVDLGDVAYIGADIVPEIVERNRREHAADGRAFLQLDLTRDRLPAADLLLCRDGLVHLSHADIRAALENVAASEIRWLLTTTFPSEPENVDIVTGDWRPIDLTKPPFELPPPVELLSEGCTEQDGAFADKSLGLWSVPSVATAIRGVR